MLPGRLPQFRLQNIKVTDTKIIRVHLIVKLCYYTLKLT
jgi:hypothetical protein